MRYILLTTKRGYIIKREPLVCRCDIQLSFDGLATDGTAIAENGERQLYLAIKGGSSTLPFSLLEGERGEICLTVNAYDGTTAYKRWSCERIAYESLGDGRYIIYPAPADRDEAVVNLALAQDKLNNSFCRIEKKIEEIEEKVNTALIGFVTE